MLKLLLLLKGNQRIVVVNIPVVPVAGVTRALDDAAQALNGSDEKGCRVVNFCRAVTKTGERQVDGRASSLASERPMARRTCDGSSAPDWHAEPALTARPWRSSAIMRSSATTPSKKRLVVLGERGSCSAVDAAVWEARRGRCVPDDRAGVASSAGPAVASHCLGKLGGLDRDRRVRQHFLCRHGAVAPGDRRRVSGVRTVLRRR